MSLVQYMCDEGQGKDKRERDGGGGGKVLRPMHMDATLLGQTCCLCAGQTFTPMQQCCDLLCLFAWGKY